MNNLNKLNKKIKKIILTAVAVFGFAFANAQEVKFGVKGGLNISNFSGDVEGNKSRIGYLVGGFAEIKISEKFSIQPELLYSAQGVNFKESGSGFTNEEKQINGYLNIPVMAKGYVAPKVSIEVGPQIGFLLNSKSKVEETVDGDVYSVEADTKKFFESTDFGLNFGLGYDLTEKLSIGGRYNLGLSNILKDAEEGEKVKNSVFSFSVGYKF